MAQHGTLALRVLQENARKPARQLGSDFLQSEELARACWAFHLEVVAIVVMEFLQRFDYEKIHGKPDGAAPVRVAAELTRLRFRRGIAHRLVEVADLQLE